MDDDEKIWPLLFYSEENFHEEIDTPKPSFLQNLKRKVKNTFTKIEKNLQGIYRLAFKKYLFFPIKMEEINLKNDPIRLELIATQVFNDIISFKYILSFNDFALFTSLRCYAKYGSYLSMSINVWNEIQNFLPKIIIKKLSDEKWVKMVYNYWSNISQEISDLIQTNKKKKNINKALIHHKMICFLITINTIKVKTLYGSTLYWASIYKKKIPEKYCLESKNYPNFVWVAVSFNSLDILTPNEKRHIKSIDFNSITEFTPFPNSLIISIEEENKIKSFRFNTRMGLEIFELFDSYRKIKNKLKDLNWD